MTKKEKLFTRFLANPCSFKYRDVEKLLYCFGFIQVSARGSHAKFKHFSLLHDIVIPVHNNDCKDFYKKYVRRILKRMYEQS